MKWQNEWQLLRSTLEKCRVPFLLLTEENYESALEKMRLQEVGSVLSSDFLTSVLPHTLYKEVDTFGLSYRYLLLPETKIPTVLLVGPFLTAPYFEQSLPEMAERGGISPKMQRAFEEYCKALPVLTDGSPVLLLLDAFCERIWDSPSFTVIDRTQSEKSHFFPGSVGMKEGGLDDRLVNMRAMEKRYAFENELMRAVAHGQLHEEKRLLSAFSGQLFEKRISDLLRNAKNYGIIMNTLLRKAAESGGVHPIYLDRISSRYAMRIEQLSNISENTRLMRDMFLDYCRLVRRHNLHHLSPVVQKAVLLIDSDLSANISLSAIAEALEVSAGYLSAAFKKETGKTLSSYVREKRMHYAAYLLESTQLQIQTVAEHCGIVDVQYFSKMFKAQRGKSPLEYRKASKSPHP